MNPSPRSGNAALYAPRRLSALGWGYSYFVKILKFALPLAALVIIGIVISRLSGGPQQQNLAALPQDEKTIPGQIELVGAKYEGVDDKGQPYTVTADKASRSLDAPDTVVFENPLADITFQDKTWVALKAKTGSFNHQMGQLNLAGEVSAYHDSGYSLRLEDIQIDLKTKAAATASPVLAQGPAGAIEARGLAIESQGDRVVFQGPVTMRILIVKQGRG